MTFHFKRKYFLLSVILFAGEVFIALFLKDRIIRPLIGDALIVVLIYCFIRTFLNASSWKIALFVFLFACSIEILQYFDYVARLHLEDNRILSAALGRTFEWSDFAAYFVGFLLILAVEKFTNGNRRAA